MRRSCRSRSLAGWLSDQARWQAPAPLRAGRERRGAARPCAGRRAAPTGQDTPRHGESTRCRRYASSSPGQRRHSDARDPHLEAHPPNLGQRCLAVGGGAEHLDVVSPPEQRGERAAHHRLVLCHGSGRRSCGAFAQARARQRQARQQSRCRRLLCSGSRARHRSRRGSRSEADETCSATWRSYTPRSVTAAPRSSPRSCAAISMPGRSQSPWLKLHLLQSIARWQGCRAGAHRAGTGHAPSFPSNAGNRRHDFSDSLYLQQRRHRAAD